MTHNDIEILLKESLEVEEEMRKEYESIVNDIENKEIKKIITGIMNDEIRHEKNVREMLAIFMEGD